LLEAIRRGTILAEAVADAWPDQLSDAGVEAGIAMADRVGLLRALFEVRLAQLARAGSPEHRLALLAGIAIGTDLSRWAPPVPGHRLLIVGGRPLAPAWHGALGRRGWELRHLPLDAAERALRVGLAIVATRAGVLGPAH
jgi:2-keto-3-deoxy-galactonokinase